MKLTDARKKFDQLRRTRGRILVRKHAWKDWPKRKFTVGEIVELVMGDGHLKMNHVDRPTTPFVWHCKDQDEEPCTLAVDFQEDESGDLIVVVSAYRKDK